MSRLILPGHSPAGRATIFVPRGYDTGEVEPIAVCRVPVGDGEVCGKLFFPGEERKFERHVGECARKHMAEIHEDSPKRRMPVFDEQTWDPEIAAHMRKVGERMIREGRLETLPSERAGF